MLLGAAPIASSGATVRRVPTRYARISVVRDPALDEALRSARGKLRASNEAGRLRELALIGAGVLNGADGERVTTRERLRDHYGARLATGELLLAARAARRAQPEAREQESVSASLDWVRGER